jgi:hypothetical protein
MWVEGSFLNLAIAMFILSLILSAVLGKLNR